MAQIDSYLKRLVAENELNYLDDFYRAPERWGDKKVLG